MAIEKDERYEATDKTSGGTATERQRLTSLWANVQNTEMGGRRKKRSSSSRSTEAKTEI
jgi:hypothetical protein